METRMLHPPTIRGATIPLSVRMLEGSYRVDKKLNIFEQTSSPASDQKHVGRSLTVVDAH
eukprot:12511287-Ditylum_brightwellii.AAC.1